MYKATIFLDTGELSQCFSSAVEAATWLDEQNNNLEYTTLIEELDEQGNVKDGFNYTRKE